MVSMNKNKNKAVHGRCTAYSFFFPFFLVFIVSVSCSKSSVIDIIITLRVVVRSKFKGVMGLLLILLSLFAVFSAGWMRHDSMRVGA